MPRDSLKNSTQLSVPIFIHSKDRAKKEKESKAVTVKQLEITEDSSDSEEEGLEIDEEGDEESKKEEPRFGVMNPSLSREAKTLFGLGK